MAKAKLEMVPAKPGQTKFAAESAELQSASGILGALAETETETESFDDSKFERLGLPPMLNIKDITVGQRVSGALVKVVENFTGRTDMRKARLIQLKHKTGTEYLLPLTGTLKNSLKAIFCPDEAARKEMLAQAKDAKDKAEIEALDFFKIKDEYVGRTIFVRRLPDGASKKYGGKTQFSLEVLMQKA